MDSAEGNYIIDDLSRRGLRRSIIRIFCQLYSDSERLQSVLESIRSHCTFVLRPILFDSYTFHLLHFLSYTSVAKFNNRLQPQISCIPLVALWSYLLQKLQFPGFLLLRVLPNIHLSIARATDFCATYICPHKLILRLKRRLYR